MKIIFIGTVYFSKKILEEIIRSNHEVVGVIGKKNKKFNSDYYDIVKFARVKKIRSIYSNNINSSNTLKWIKKKLPDFIFCIGWNQLLNKELLKIPFKGVIGYHPSDLPKNRGRHPIIWSIALGLNKIGSCFFYMKEKADSGNIISKKIIKIKNQYDSFVVYKKLIKIGVKQIRIILKNLKFLKYIPQNNAEVNYWRKRSEIDGRIDWRMDAENINNLIKSLVKPYPGANFLFKKKKFTVWKAKVIKTNKKNIEPGKIIRQNKNTLQIKCGNNSLQLIKFEPKIKLQNIKYL